MFERNTLQQTAELLFRHQQSVAVAESVTAGLLQLALASTENASFFFQGGITAYNARQKYKHLQVDLKEAISCNSVSASVASQMALGVSKTFSSDWGIGITGYSSPLPGHGMNPLFAYYSICFKNETVTTAEITTPDSDPFYVQMHYVNSVLKAFFNSLKENEASA